jgi:hypothetical protein
MTPMDPLSTTLRSTDVMTALSSPRVDERDDATRVAIATGGALGPRLLRFTDEPPTVRARRLWAYTGIHMRRGEDGLRRARRYDLRHRGTLRSALEVLGVLHGVPIAADLPTPDAPIAIELPQATLLAALDAICAQAGGRGAQGVRGELIAQAGAEPRYPVCYSGPVRVRVVELRVLRATDFASATASAQLRLRVDWEWPIQPVSPPILKLDGLTARVHDAAAIGGSSSEIVVDLEPPAGPLALAGTLTALFDGPFDEVPLAVPGTLDLHGLAIAASVDDQGVMLTLNARARPDAGVLGLSPALLAIASDGEETLPQVQRMRTMGAPAAAAGAASERWRLRVRDGMAPIGELRLRVAAPPVRVSLPIAIAAVPMP